jgi:flagellin-specific chaperone FliS
MTNDIFGGYRAAMFDGELGVHWLRPAWQALRFYGRQAAEAIEAGDRQRQAEMILRADRLLILLTGLLDTDRQAALGTRMLRVYTALQAALFRANSNNDAAELAGFDEAVEKLARDMMSKPKIAAAA